ncbi:quinate 5-dehydrogenase [Desulfofundulus thermobenzoicus]|uniref:Quinate 5-dehydrogenase n=1 Tax=Desulfofundulus thermobenzoicus TaxID=29376 RepID=A0A6N7IN98_9FIRM|nr:quinate 5-dehydrogenase [Desulfofundulus thermobenzoicus]MQL51113.1 quinate 5-dehydrogenase [Desulfofundulus thermobenzoicus]HHW44707.1 quinate 5-dehydrogenase [Desulfotomaculum sp.]
MKRVVSVSLGSSRRDHRVEVDLLGEHFEISRRGTDGDFQRAIELLRELDGKVDAIGLGGIDVYLYAGKTRYTVQDGLKLMEAVRHTPVVDGSGLKNTLERETAYFLREHTGLLPPGTRVLMVSAVDRFGMAEALAELGCDLTFGDLIFSAGIPYPIRTVAELEEMAARILPEMVKLPFHMLYPTGKKQETQDEEKIKKFGHYYQEAQVIAGDYHLMRRYMPRLNGQIIITNTTTADDVAFLKEKGAGYLVTTTPEFEGRSFGTNVMEAVLVALLQKPREEITARDYRDCLKRLDFKPRVVPLQ